MTENKIKSAVGYLLVLGQSSIIIYIFILTKKTFFFSEAFDLIALIAPLFSVFLVSITKDFINPSKKLSSQKAKFNYAFISLFYPVIFLSTLFFAIVFYENHTIRTFENLKKIIGIIETSFGVYLGIVIDTIFPKKAKN